MKDIHFLDDVTDSDQFIITDLKTQKIENLYSSLYTRVQINLNEKYYLDRKQPLILKDIILDDNNHNGNYI
ncbi:MAG: hypothetical protein ACXAAH_17580, partial [Promethearchaeota archaeon]